MSRIEVNKAPGPDGLPDLVLRDFCGQLSGPVCAIFNTSLREGCVQIAGKRPASYQFPQCIRHDPLHQIYGQLLRLRRSGWF